MRFALPVILLSMTSVSVSARQPDYILESPGQPHVAVYKNEQQGFPIGCKGIREAWGAIPVQSVTAADWGKELTGLTLADIHCDERTRKYSSAGEPSSVVLTGRDGGTQRHYIDDIAFHRDISGPVVKVTQQQLIDIAPVRGVDFQAKRKQPTPTPVPSPAPTRNAPSAGNQPPTFASYWSGSYFYIDAKNTSGNTRTCNYSFTFSYDDYGMRKQRTENSSFSLYPGFSGNAVKFAGAWVNPRKEGEPSIQCN